MFSSDRAGGAGHHDLYVSTRASKSAPWSTPVPVTELNTPDQDYDPFIGHGGRELFWAAGTSLAIHWAARASAGAPFSTPVILTELGASYDPTLSPDLRHIMFASSRLGSHDIFEAWR